jgi:SagB-type dehydrogenase family enzyme
LIALRYHESTKHHFNRFARSLGYLDWATQPDPFRRYAGAPLIELPRGPLAADVPYAALFDGSARPRPVSDDSVAEFLRCSMGLSAWKQYQRSRWALRVNPSSGNLHPTEAYIVRDSRVCHYAPREHALEERTLVSPDAWLAYTRGGPGLLVALTSILWREAWKYGERGFRYCQHDTGHAIAALRLSAAMLGWRMTLLPRWTDAEIATLLGLDRDIDYADAEREEPECLAVVTAGDVAPWLEADPAPLVDAARAAAWGGTANRLSGGHVAWPAIDEVAEATRGEGRGRGTGNGERLTRNDCGEASRLSLPEQSRPPSPAPHAPARQIILQRRSAVAFDGKSRLPRETFFAMLERLQPSSPPWDAIDWPPQIHLLLFVHRVDGLVPGVYAYFRDETTVDEWRAAMRPEFLWESVDDTRALGTDANRRTSNPNDPNAPNGPNGSTDRLFLLLPTDVTWVANRASCDQDIAADGFFSLGMIARFEPALRERGEWFYRRLFWEAGLIGQVLYLEAEAAGARATGIGCFYDDAVHDLAGLSGNGWQSLYHFSMGVHVDDERLTTEPGYPWETNTR